MASERLEGVEMGVGRGGGGWGAVVGMEEGGVLL